MLQTLTSADRNTLPPAEEPGVQLFCEANVRGGWGPVQAQREVRPLPTHQSRCCRDHTHQRILLKFHSCLSFNMPANTCSYFGVQQLPLATEQLHLLIPQICGSSIQDWWLDRVMSGVSGGLWSTRFHSTSWLWTVKLFMCSRDGERQTS